MLKIDVAKTTLPAQFTSASLVARARALLEEGFSLLSAGQFERADKLAREVLGHFQHSSDAYYLRAMVAEKMGKNDAARHCLDQLPSTRKARTLSTPLD
jgi:Tfp pilus assembly protein PilF